MTGYHEDCSAPFVGKLPDTPVVHLPFTAWQRVLVQLEVLEQRVRQLEDALRDDGR